MTSILVQNAFPAISDWEAAYSNRKAIPDMGEWLADSTRRSQAFLAGFTGRKSLGVAYGDQPRQTIDIFEPEGQAAGTLVFVHGGYWRATSTSDHHCFAAGALSRGWRVAMIEYPLCPTVHVSDITAGIVQALEHLLGQLVPQGDVILSGHSAGGQLVTHAVSRISGLSETARRRIGRVVSLSGVHDLRPLLRYDDINADLRLTEDEAARMSPVLTEPGHTFDLYCVCGGGELPEFRRQNALIANAWAGFGIATVAAETSTDDHFRILDRLTDPEEPLTRLLAGEALPTQGA